MLLSSPCLCTARRTVIAVGALGADVIALEAINDRAVLEKIFDKTVWQLVIEDDSDDAQNVAVAAKKPLEVVGIATDVQGRLDAQDSDFLFPTATDNSFFPDLLPTPEAGQLEKAGEGRT